MLILKVLSTITNDDGKLFTHYLFLGNLMCCFSANKELWEFWQLNWHRIKLAKTWSFLEHGLYYANANVCECCQNLIDDRKDRDSVRPAYTWRQVQNLTKKPFPIQQDPTYLFVEAMMALHEVCAQCLVAGRHEYKLPQQAVDAGCQLPPTFSIQYAELR
jgi:hypothetical protein